ncbi:MAG: Fic family protein [Alphaproteobacteria bacterium]|jgi:Fic family protein
MSRNQLDIEAAKIAVPDRGERITSMEPMLISESSRHRAELGDLVVELAAAAAGFRRALPGGIHSALAALVRSMNCYYSNLIEGHDTHPVDIERALQQDYSADPHKRDLQIEARAHIEVQSWIDAGGLIGRAATTAGICEIHEQFCRLLPEDLLYVENPDTKKRLPVVPGALRTRDVRVGQHIAISPGSLPRFLTRFEEAYNGRGRTEQILCAAAAHHRLLWIHPFVDGNGRVARLMSNAMLLESLDPGGIWSVARGLARTENAYKGHLASCDLVRRNDLDGRGARSEEALAAFTKYFLETCLDQIRFMESLVQPDRLRARILTWAAEETRLSDLPPKSGAVLEAILYRGELPRGEVPYLLGYKERQARRVVAALTARNVVVSDSSRAPLRLNFAAEFVSRWMPGLFPERES